MSNRVLLKQWKLILIKENKFEKNATKEHSSRTINFLSDKIPDKLEETLNSAFIKAFELIFEKGTNVIEKTYSKQSIQQNHQVNNFAFSVYNDQKRLNAINHKATKTTFYSTVFSGVKGVGLGILGIGLPDIPIFIGTIFRGIYEIALQYGCDYNTEEEKYFILNIISTSLSHGKAAIEANRELNNFMANPQLPYGYSRSTEVEKVSNVLSQELLYLKFVQGLPIIGAAGGVFDAKFTNQILGYAKLKYKRRYLLNKI
ncbi:MAG: hypothetical protein ATN31_09725 [Candidatus Epulonipiscioides saccharophilum]|nr:MAG: hypothetical protein ATN31_09725 [Epulopiscium sp. AS2M-Bin001]